MSHRVPERIDLAFPLLPYLNDALHREDGGEDDVELAEQLVGGRLLVHRVLGGQGGAAQQYHKHDAAVEPPPGHQPVDADADAARIREVKRVTTKNPVQYLKAIITHGLVEDSMKSDE